jgi:hypothetical protein
VQILIDNAFAGIQHHHHHMRILDGLQGLDDREFSTISSMTAAPPHAGGINQREFCPMRS